MIGQVTISTIEKICQYLLNYDPNIVEIIQFGSSVYAPEHAKDLDLLVITKEEKDYNTYIDSLDQLDLPFDVDIVVREIGRPLKGKFACQVLGSFEILYGDGRHLVEITKDFDPSFEEAYAAIRVVKRDLERLSEIEISEDRGWTIRRAFNGLFHASRIASMAFLATENARWGRIKRRLPQPYRDEFDDFINILHIKYFYNGDYPQNVEEEFERWHRRVESFVKKLESGRV